MFGLLWDRRFGVAMLNSYFGISKYVLLLAELARWLRRYLLCVEFSVGIYTSACALGLGDMRELQESKPINNTKLFLLVVSKPSF